MRLCFSLLISSLLSLVPLANAQSPNGVGIQARVQLWEKMSTRPGDAKYYPLANEERLKAWVHYKKGTSFVKRRYEADGLVAGVTFYQVVPERGLPYIATQIRLEHSTHGFIAECSRYDGLKSPDIGIGSCSGRLGTKQVGVSILKDSAKP
jgi:hypothetical protein